MVHRLKALLPLAFWSISALVHAAPKVSICIPTYSAEPWLPAALDSACGQTLGDIEIVCVDDGSRDGSLAILKSYAAKDPRIRVLENGTNRGTHYSRIRAILAAEGEFILWLDSDDELFPDIAEKAFAKAEAMGADIVLYGAEFYGRMGKRIQSPWHRMRLPETEGRLDSDGLIDQVIEGNISPTCWDKLWRREC
ncbi:MAG: glycosyltransferase [Puniceicoccales bacterium]|nr:glycosyltransferase [Puniceicoccales bacterium]